MALIVRPEEVSLSLYGCNDLEYSKAHLQLIRNVVDHISENIDQQLTLGDLAAVSGLSESYLRKLFKELTGYSIGRYTQDTRVYQALRRLKQDNSKSSIIDVALAAGYDNHSAFSRAFRKVMGVAPSQVDNNTVIGTVRQAQLFRPQFHFDLPLTYIDRWRAFGRYGMGFRNWTFPQVQQVSRDLREYVTHLGEDPDKAQWVFVQLGDNRQIPHDYCPFFFGVLVSPGTSINQELFDVFDYSPKCQHVQVEHSASRDLFWLTVLRSYARLIQSYRYISLDMPMVVLGKGISAEGTVVVYIPVAEKMVL